MSILKVKKKDGSFSEVATKEYVNETLTQPISINISNISWGGNIERTGIITTEQFFNLKPYRDRVWSALGECMIYYIEETLTTTHGNLGIVKTIHYGAIQGANSLQTLTLAFRTADHTLWDSAGLGAGGSN